LTNAILIHPLANDSLEIGLARATRVNFQDMSNEDRNAALLAFEHVFADFADTLPYQTVLGNLVNEETDDYRITFTAVCALDDLHYRRRRQVSTRQEIAGLQLFTNVINTYPANPPEIVELALAGATEVNFDTMPNEQKNMIAAAVGLVFSDLADSENYGAVMARLETNA